MKSNTIVNSKVKLVADSFGYYHLLLKITNRYSGKVYICKHSTKNPYDNYMGSSMYVTSDIKTYGSDAFTKEILESVEDAEILNLYEKSVVDDDFLKNSYTYNIYTGGGGPKVHTRRGYLNQLERKQKKLQKVKTQHKQVIQLIKDTKTKSNLEFQLYSFIHNSISLVKSILCKIISIGISLTYLLKTILF